MRYRWIATTVAVTALAYTAGSLVAYLLYRSESSSSFPLVVRLGMGVFLIVAAVAGVLAYQSRRGMVKWRRILAEQRLWESGPLGRRWLARRRKLSDREPW